MDTLMLALRVVLSLAAVLGVIWYAQRRISRGTRGGRAKTISVVGRQSVGSKASVAVVDVDGKRFLLGVTEHAVTILHTADAPLDSADAFSRALSEETTEHATELSSTHSAPAGALLRPTPQSPLAGSLLSADTWRRAFASLKP
jgi:flagellar protein FliO/FliZ